MNIRAIQGIAAALLVTLTGCAKEATSTSATATEVEQVVQAGARIPAGGSEYIEATDSTLGSDVEVVDSIYPDGIGGDHEPVLRPDEVLNLRTSVETEATFGETKSGTSVSNDFGCDSVKLDIPEDDAPANYDVHAVAKGGSDEFVIVNRPTGKGIVVICSPVTLEPDSVVLTLTRHS